MTRLSTTTTTYVEHSCARCSHSALGCGECPCRLVKHGRIPAHPKACADAHHMSKTGVNGVEQVCRCMPLNSYFGVLVVRNVTVKAKMTQFCTSVKLAQTWVGEGCARTLVRDLPHQLRPPECWRWAHGQRRRSAPCTQGRCLPQPVVHSFR